MSDKVVILGIVFLYDEIFRIELRNESKNEEYCVFVKKEELYNMLNSAMEKGDEK